MPSKYSKRLGIGFVIILLGVLVGVTFLNTSVNRTVFDVWHRFSGQAEAMHSSEARYVRQLVESEADTNRLIMWQSDVSEEGAYVEYRQLSGDDGHVDQAIERVEATNRYFEDDGDSTYIHEASINNLQADSHYQYRVGYGNKVSEWHDLKTSDSHASYTALIFPDSQSVDYSTWGQVVKRAFERNPNAAFFTVMGDLVDNGEDSSQWRAWMENTASLMDSVPAGMVIGNHETYTINWKMRDPIAYTNYWTYPENNVLDFKNRYYSFDYGDVHYVSLDTTFPEMEGIHDDLEDKVLEWLRNDLANHHKKWTVVMMHRDILRYPIASRGREAGIEDFSRPFVDLFEAYKVDIVFTGHLHTYRNRGHLLQYEHNSAGPLYILTGIAGDTTVKNFWNDHPLDLVKAPNGQDTENYITLDVSDDRLVMKAFLPDGSQFDEETIEK